LIPFSADPIVNFVIMILLEHSSGIIIASKKYIDTKQSNKRNNQNSKDKRQDYNMKSGATNDRTT